MKAEEYGIGEQPHVPVLAWVVPEDGHLLRDPCIAEQGFQQTSGGGWIGADGDRKTEFLTARWVCLAKYPPISKYIGPLTDGHLGKIYDWIIATEIPCLEERGHSIGDVPTREEYIATYFSKPFFPFEQLPAYVLNGPKFEELHAACPQWPSSAFIYED